MNCRILLVYIAFLVGSFLQGQENALFVKDIELSPKISIGAERPGWVCLTGEIATLPHWIPSTVELRAEVANYGTKEGNFHLAMHLPASSRKRFYLYVYLSHNQSSVEFSVETKSGPVLQKKVELVSQYPTMLRIGYFVPNGNYNLFYLKNIRKYTPWTSRSSYNNTLEEIEVVPMDANLLPDRWIGYQRLDLMVMPQQERLSKEKAKAIEEWIYAGGILLVAPQEKASLRHCALLQKLLGYALDDAKMEYVPSLLTEYLPTVSKALALEPPKDASVDSTLGNVLWDVKRGAGTILYFGQDVGNITGESSKLWENVLLTKIQTAIAYRNAYTGVVDQPYDDSYQTAQALDLASLRMPGIWTILLCLIGYLLLVGPLNFFYLRKKGLTLHLVWTIPLLSFLFVLVILGYGYWSRGAYSESFSAEIVQSVRNTSSLYHQKYTSLLSASHTIYDINLANNGSLLPFYSNYRGQDSANPSLRQHEGLMLEDYPLTLWQTGYFQAEFFRHNMPFRLTLDHNKNIASLQKPAGFSLKKMVLLHSQKYALLGDMKANATRKEFPYVPEILAAPADSHYTWIENCLQKLELEWKLGKPQVIRMLTQDLIPLLNQNQQHYILLALLEEDGTSPFSITPVPIKQKEIKVFCYKYFGNEE